MRYTSAIVVAACLLRISEKCINSNAFSVRISPTSGGNSAIRPSCNQLQEGKPLITPLKFAITSGGIEELQEWTEKQSTSVLERQVRKSPSLWKIAGYVTIPLSAILGFGIAPSRRLAAHAVGAVVTGMAGAIGKSKLDAVTELAALPAIAHTIIEYGIDDPATTNHYIESLKELHGFVVDDDFEDMCVEIYSKYLLGMIKNDPRPRSSETKELGNLKIALGLSNLLVGEAHAAAAEEWYRTTCYFTPEEDLLDPDHPDRQAMDKFLFLTERALAQGKETKEAFTFEMDRVAKSMKLDAAEAMERVSEVQVPFYKRALEAARANLSSGKVSGLTLERARNTLGIDEETAREMHVTCFNKEVCDQIGLNNDNDDDNDEFDPSTTKFGDESKKQLELLQDILFLSPDDAQYEITTEVTPLFQGTALSAMNAVISGIKTPEDAWDEIDTRRTELLLPEKDAKGLIHSIVSQALGRPLEKTNKFAKVNNEAAVYENILEALDAKGALIEILAQSEWAAVDDFYASFCDPWAQKGDKGVRTSAISFIDINDRIKLYKIFLVRSARKAEEGKITDEVYDCIKEVQGLLAISDDEADVQARLAFGPELQNACIIACDEIVKDCTPDLAKNMEKNINDVIDNYRISEDFVREIGGIHYEKAVKKISEKSPGGIPTTEMNEALKSLADMYRLGKEDTSTAHIDVFGTVYMKSVLEAMGSTGVIRPELRDGLADLRQRLGVREEDTKELFLQAIEKKFVPMVEWINYEVERTQLTQKQLSERRGKDMGEDVFQTGKSADGTLGIGAEVNVMGDIMNLVDFYNENNITEQKEIGTKEIDQEKVPVLETSYPITAIGSETIDLQMAEYLYRQFVVGAFTAHGEQASRYEGARATFGGILGLTSEKMEEINDSIGSSVYDNFVSQSMAQKGSLDQQDMMFLANIQTKLGLSSEQGEKLVVESQKRVLSEEIDRIMDNPTPGSIKVFREKCYTMGMDLADDVGISKNRLVNMFEQEVIPGLKSGEINVESSDKIVEIKESLNLDDGECEALLEKTVLSLAKNAMDTIEGELLRGREENTVDLIKEFVRYAAFMDGDLQLNFDEAIAWQVYNIFDALDFSGSNAEIIERKKELLKTALGISEENLA